MINVRVDFLLPSFFIRLPAKGNVISVPIDKNSKTNPQLESETFIDNLIVGIREAQVAELPPKKKNKRVTAILGKCFLYIIVNSLGFLLDYSFIINSAHL